MARREKRPGAGLMPTAIGVDIGGTNLRAARVTNRGEILERISERITRDPEMVVGRIIDLVSRLDRPDVAAIGIGVPGRVDARRQEVLSGGYLNLAGAALAERLEAAVGKPVTLDNDGNMALVAEVAVGAGRGCDNVVMFTIGTGIGGAVMEDRKLVRGRMAAGQLGHVTVDIEGGVCACGRRGCVETTSSGTALGRLVEEAGLPAGLSADDLFARVQAGDEAAITVLTRWSRPMRAAIDSIVAAFDPDMVVLGGGLGASAHRALTRFAPAPSAWYQCNVAAAALGDDAGVIGGAISALMEHHMDAPVARPDAVAAAL